MQSWEKQVKPHTSSLLALNRRQHRMDCGKRPLHLLDRRLQVINAILNMLVKDKASHTAHRELHHRHQIISTILLTYHSINSSIT